MNGQRLRKSTIVPAILFAICLGGADGPCRADDDPPGAPQAPLPNEVRFRQLDDPQVEEERIRRLFQEREEATIQRLRELGVWSDAPRLVFAGTPSGFLLSDAHSMLAKTRPDGLRFQYIRGGDDRGLQELLKGTAEVAVVRTEIDDESRKKLEARFGKEIEERLVARLAIVIAVHPQNRVKQISIPQLRRVFRGEITDWKELGGDPGPIVRLGTIIPKLSRAHFLETVLEGHNEPIPGEADINPNKNLPYDELLAKLRELHARFPGGGPYARFETDEEVPQAIAKEPGAIGYYLMPTAPDWEPRDVKPLALSKDGTDPAYLPTRPHVLTGRYPLQPLLRCIVPGTASPEARALVDFACGERCADLIDRCGWIAAYRTVEYLRDQPLASTESGAGDGGK